MSKGLIVGIIVKNQVLCKEYTYINLGIYTLVNNWAARCCLCRVTNDKSTVVDIAICAQNATLLHSYINRQYDRSPPIKILHKYPKEAYST